MEKFHAHACPLLDQVMVAITHMGSALVLAPLEIVFLCWLLGRRRTAIAIFLAAAVGGGAALNSVFKGVFLRSRPELWGTLVSEHSYSFPSGHAMHTMALFVALAFAFRNEARGRWHFPFGLGLVFVFLVGFSRVYLGVHYPSDVLAGWMAAIAWVALCSLLLREEHQAIFSRDIP
ncbi:phosphatase PAP2 family protein [Herbaspirillum sp. WKF16]|uniref:phosphatase PAP2 family protein n=1 Tax=Herbaspirillum sp. WKF16 TaxID=3028312 RepID=UPI0023A947C0|nr:phosphatase PAP2 family protein [Herbaspirillum sp. WKF16]WDZ95802.1 phosphatase PAP2 family protein [Herbaspirillum sp. WKF16]